MLGTLGILTGNVLYFALSAIGLGTLLMTLETLFYGIKWAGAGYLICLGGKMIRNSCLRQTSASPYRAAVSRPRLFSRGLLTQLANPKAIGYFTALLPQFIDPEQAPTLQFCLLGITSVVVEFPVLVAYGWLAHKGGYWVRQEKYTRWIDRFAGTFLIGAGVKLAFIRRA